MDILHHHQYTYTLLGLSMFLYLICTIFFTNMNNVSESRAKPVKVLIALRRIVLDKNITFMHQ